MENLKFYKQGDGLWLFSDENEMEQYPPAASSRYLVNGNKITIRLIGEADSFVNGVDVTKIQKSATPDDFYADIAEFLTATKDFFRASGDGGGLGRVSFDADDGQTVFNSPADTSIILLLLDQLPQESGFAGIDTSTITFDTGLVDGQKVTLFYNF